MLLSGGLDSTTCLAIAQAEGFELYALAVYYGQRHDVEMQAARRVAEAYDVARYEEAQIDLRIFGGSALTSEAAVPKGRSLEEMDAGIPITYVPARNTIFLSYALAMAEVVGARDIYIGVNALDYSGYPDCRPEFIAAYEKMANQATRIGTEGGDPIRIHAPLLHLTKGDIVRKGIELGVDYGLTHTCYDPSPEGIACGECDSCLLRLKGFAEAGIEDPVPYQNRPAGGAE